MIFVILLPYKILFEKMKKILTFTILGALLTLTIAACSTSTAGHCDAYGNIHQAPKSDLASK